MDDDKKYAMTIKTAHRVKKERVQVNKKEFFVTRPHPGVFLFLTDGEKI